MAGLFTYSLAGVGFLFIAAVEALLHPLHPYLRPLSAAALSLLAVLDSLISSLSSSSHDPLGSALPLASLALSSLFVLYSLSDLLSLRFFPLPSPFLDLLLFSAFLQELLLLFLGARKDPDGLEHRYFSLLVVPVLVCAISTIFSLARPGHRAPRVSRAAALALHGTWLVQIGFSLFSSAIAHGCELRRRSRANYTVRCHAHNDSHRAAAIATLQFNCHLALLVVAGAVVYAVFVAGGSRRRESPGYRPLNKELQRMEHVSDLRFTLDSEEEDEEGRIHAVADKQHHDAAAPISEVNGIHASH